jgi:hypothetical protein
LFAGLADCAGIGDNNVISFDPIVVYLSSRKEKSNANRHKSIKSVE